MAGDQYGDAYLIERLKQVHNFSRQCRIEVAGRLIRQ